MLPILSMGSGIPVSLSTTNNSRLCVNTALTDFADGAGVPAIDDEVFKNGTVQAYVWNVYDVSQNLGAWNLLPFVYPLEVYLPNDQGGQDLVMVPENMRFEWEKGAVTLIVQDLDGYRPVEIAETLSFRISVIKNM